MKLKRRYSIALLLAIVFLLSLSIPVLAIDVPDLIYQINQVYVYRNCLETGDQLYLIDYMITYTVNPAENITEAFLFRLMNGAVELGSVAPYSYYNDGYDRGVASIYFSAADAPAWNGAYSMQLAGNPALVWNPATPSTSMSPFGLWADNPIGTTQTLLASRVLWLADQMELAWSVDMIETLSSGNALTTYGEAYFTNVIENLRLMAPLAFSGQSIQPEVETTAFTQDYANDLVTDIIGTPFDFTTLGTALGLSRGMVTAIIYYAIVILVLILVACRIQTYKPIMLLSVPFVIGGAFIGVPLVITIVVGFLALVMVGFALFYKGATA